MYYLHTTVTYVRMYNTLTYVIHWATGLCDIATLVLNVRII